MIDDNIIRAIIYPIYLIHKGTAQRIKEGQYQYPGNNRKGMLMIFNQEISQRYQYQQIKKPMFIIIEIKIIPRHILNFRIISKELIDIKRIMGQIY